VEIIILILLKIQMCQTMLIVLPAVAVFLVSISQPDSENVKNHLH